MPSLNELKKQVLEASLNKGKAKLAVDTQVPGVQLPPHLMAHPGCAINLSRRFPGALHLGELMVMAELSFNREIFKTVLPWESILAIEDADTFHDFIKLQTADTEVQRTIAQGLAQQAVTEQVQQMFKPEVIVDNSEKLGIGEIILTPPKRGHLRLLN